jgi:hypothetical protein
MIRQHPLSCKIIPAIASFSLVLLHLNQGPHRVLACKLLDMTMWVILGAVGHILQVAPWPYVLVHFFQGFGIFRQLLEIGAAIWALFCVSVR